MAVIRKRSDKEILKKWTDLYFSEKKRSGYIAITDKNFKRNRFYNSDEVGKVISETKGKEDIYISLNAFGYDSKRSLRRKASHLRQIRNIGIDIDQYKLNLSIDDVIDTIQSLILENKIPEPNMILTSRGVQVLYSVNAGAAPDMDWLAGYITEQLTSELENIGADYNAAGMSRVMRLPGTINSRNNAIVEYDIWNNEAYTLQELQYYCAPLKTKKNRKNDNLNTLKFPGGNLFQVHRTNWARKQDLKTLFELRNGDFTGCRNTYVYIMAFQQTLILPDNYEQVLNSVRSLTKGIYSTDRTAEDIESILNKTVKSAYKDGVAFMDYLEENNYRILNKRNDKIIKPYKTENILKKLGITEDEQNQMRTLKNENIKRKHHAEYMRNQRREKGTKPMKEYNKERSTKKDMQAQQAAALKAQGMKQKDIAAKLDISAAHVSRLIKHYKEIANNE